jgi:glycerol-3-phosphate acyltransferase PlsY
MLTGFYMESSALGILAIVLSSYFLGGIPAGFVIGRLWGVDVRKKGSGNIGATNVNRLVGRTAGALTLLIDLLKGILATFLPEILGYPQIVGGAAIAGGCAVLGHCYSPFLLLQGGKGVATALGVFLSLAPGAAFWGFLLAITAIGLTRYVSLGSILGVWLSTALIITGSIGFYSNSIQIASLFVALLITVRHGSNIRRLMVGTEHRF